MLPDGGFRLLDWLDLAEPAAHPALQLNLLQPGRHRLKTLQRTIHDVL